MSNYNQQQPPPYGFAPPPQPGYADPNAGNYGGTYGGQPQGQQQGPPLMPPPMHMAPPPGVYADAEANKYGVGFDDKAIRAGFIRKVFGLLTVMLLIVVAMVAVPTFDRDGVGEFVRTNPWVYFASYVVFLIVYLALMCCESVRRSFPVNFVLLFVLTCSIGYMTAMITAFHKAEFVFIALAITTVCCGSIIIFSMQTKYDFTKLMGVMFVIFMVLFFFGIIAIICRIFWNISWMYLLYSAGMALVFMVFLAIDVQMVMGGKKYELSPEEYIFATIQLFLDIVYIFWFILQLLGSSNN